MASMEFEQARVSGIRKRKRTFRQRKLLLNEKVEVRSMEEGFLGSWHSGIVTECDKRGHRCIKYDHLLDDNECSNLVDNVCVSPILDGVDSGKSNQHNYRGNIRPIPPQFELNKWGIHFGQCVDVYYNDAWWEGVIFDHEDGTEERKIFFPDLGDEMLIPVNSMRVTHYWDEVSGVWKQRGSWIFLELIEKYEENLYLAVSVKQLWYDVREKKGFKKMKEWTSTLRDLWEILLFEVIEDNFRVTVNELFDVLVSDGLLSETQVALEPDLPVTDDNRNFKMQISPPKSAQPTTNSYMDLQEELDPSYAVLSVDENLLNKNTVIDHEAVVKDVMDFSRAGMNEPFQAGPDSSLVEFGIDQPVCSAKQDASNINSSHQSNMVDHNEAICALPFKIDTDVSISHDADLFGNIAKKINRRIKCSIPQNTGKWIPVPQTPEPEFNPNAIDQYSAYLETSKSERSENRNALISNLKKHVSYLGWKIEYMRGKHKLVRRYVSPDGKACYSLNEICKHLKKSSDVIAWDADPISANASLNDLQFCRVPELPLQTRELNYSSPAVVRSEKNTVFMKPEYCPQALKEYNRSIIQNQTIKGKDLKLLKMKARKHLAAEQRTYRCLGEGKKKNCYESPTGVVCKSLRSVCRQYFMSCPSAFRLESINSNSENELQFSGNGPSLSVSSPGLQKSLVPPDAPSKRLFDGSFYQVKSNNLVGRDSAKLKGLRGLKCKAKKQLVDDGSPMHKMKTRNSRNDGLKSGLEIDGNLRHSKNPHVTLPRMKKVKQSGAHYNFKDNVNALHPACFLRSSKRVQKAVTPSTSHHNPRTILSWLIDNDVVVPREKVSYFSRKGCNSRKDGRITCNGIKCCCCQKLFSISDFEVHAGGTNCRRTANIFLKDGRSLLDCQKEILASPTNGSLATERCQSIRGTEREGKNDYICSVCHYGGKLMLCDQCPSSFHMSCLGLKDIPDGNWFCPSCCCVICGQCTIQQDTAHTAGRLFGCCQCERKYHRGCLKTTGPVTQVEHYSTESWFCSTTCKEIFSGLQELMGKPIPVGKNNLTWTLLKYVNPDICHTNTPKEVGLIENASKLSVALGVMHECFEPVMEPYTNRDLVEDVIFCRGSDLNRLNFQGFYTVLLESNDELITVATVRFLGQKVAEVPLVGTQFQHRRRGMCRILMNVLEKKLNELGVERLVLPAVPSLLKTWTSSFGFSQMTDSERLRLLDNTFLNFQDTIMCQKLLVKTSSDETSPLKEIEPRLHANNFGHDKKDFDKSSPVSEVYQAEQIEESGNVDQGLLEISAGNSSGVLGSQTDAVTKLKQTHHLERSSQTRIECSMDDHIVEREIDAIDDHVPLRYYKRKRKSSVEAEALQCNRV